MSGELLGGADVGLSWKDEYQVARKGVDESGSTQWGRRRPAVRGGHRGLWAGELLDARCTHSPGGCGV